MAASSCGKDPAPGAGGSDSSTAKVSLEGQLARERAAVLFAEDRMEEARTALRPLLEVSKPAGQDLLRMGILDLAAEDAEAARINLDHAEKALNNSASLHYNLGRLARRESDFETAAKHYARAHFLAPGDTPSLFQLAAAKATLGEAEAEALFQQLLDLGVDNTSSWHLAALYRLGRFQLKNGDSTASRVSLREFSRLQASGLGTLSATQMDRGNFGSIALPCPVIFAGEDVSAPTFSDGGIIALASIKGFVVADLVDDWVLPDAEESTITSMGATNLIAWGEQGIVVAEQNPVGFWETRSVWSEAVDLVRCLDFDQDGDLDFWAISANQVQLLQQENGVFSALDISIPALPGPVLDAVVVDQDHEGDLDLLLVGNFGVRLWRDDGAALKGQFTDVTEAAGIALSGTYSWCVTEDFDTDEDVDFLVGGVDSVVVLSNLRGGKFGTKSFAFSASGIGAQKPEVGDWNGDGRPDLSFGDGSLWNGMIGGDFKKSEASAPPAIALVDLDRDDYPDFLSLNAEGVQISLGEARSSGSMTLALRGTTDNRRAVGAIIEYRAGNLYRRVYWRGEPQVLDLGNHTQADWLKIKWPNGVTQFGVDIPDKEFILLIQKEGLAGSCPFLYTWNGTTYEFISDVIGATPLGLPIAEGFFVPPDHDEYVLVSGKQLVERDGFLDIQFTEELREVSFLDRVRLDVLDHPASSEVFPTERFTFPPFPEAHNHSVVDPLSPSHVIGSDGKDWTSSLQAIDLDFAVPFEPYQSTLKSDRPWGGQFLGLAPSHSLEIEFQSEAIQDAPKLRLLMTGWFYWSVASVNMASSRTPGIDFVPPLLEVPDGRGGWTAVEPSIGFPAGKLKTMVLDVSDILVREDPRIRLSSTLRLYWDSIRLATDADDAPLRVTSLEPVAADLWQRGFSKPVELEKAAELLLEWFQWDELEPYPRWNQHPGLYTKLGDVLPLLTKAEDMFVVMGSGDAIKVRFDATALPSLPAGWQRDYLVYLDGWAKDRDHSCVNVEYTEPFPFHAMSGFPYGADEAFPDNQAFRAWRLEWLTRPARLWLDEVMAQ